MNINKITSKIFSEGSELLNVKRLAESVISPEIVSFRHSITSTNPLAPLTRDTVEITALSKFEDKLELNFRPEPLEVMIGGKAEVWSKYADSQMGSQDAFWAKNETTGELFYIKFAETKAKERHIESEVLASKLYNLAGFETPEIVPITIDGGKKAFASKYISELKEAADPKSLHQGFAVDAWLANWDALQYGNTFVKNGKIIKLDNGGALKYRAMGELKPKFGDKVEELVTLTDGRNPESQWGYSTMTHEELVESFKKVCGISDKSIQKTVKDKELAQVLINRKNYMKEVLAEMERTPYSGDGLAKYFSKISTRLSSKFLFSSKSVLDSLSMVLNSKISLNKGYFMMPSTKAVAKDLVSEIKQLEKRGGKVSYDDVKKLLQELVEDGVDLNSAKIEKNFKAVCEMEEQYHRMFIGLSNFAAKNPPKDGESMTSYLSRIVKLRERRVKQLDDYRIKTIKSKLTYEPELNPQVFTILTPAQRKVAIEELEAARIRDLRLGNHSAIPKLKADATDKQIYKAWQMAHMGVFEFSDIELQKAVMGIGGRYNSKKPIKTKTIYELIADKDYKQEFDIEPVYHWFTMDKPEKFVKTELPKTGEIYTLPLRQCCSTHKHYAETDYGDHVPYLNVKFIFHPKSETSRAYNLGYNQEVVYPAGEQFRILDKECVEYIDSKTGLGSLRWEVHMQEV